ncbi:MAG: two-component sensor histidine kinase, partial [Cellvibrio sp.]
MKSIRGFLVIISIAIITLANFAAAVRGYFGSMDEAERLFNERLLQQVDLLNYALPALESLKSQQTPYIFPARTATEATLEF